MRSPARTIERDLDSALAVGRCGDLAAHSARAFRRRCRSTTVSTSNGYQLNGRRLARLQKHAIVMHPGPYNRGMELDDTVLEFAGWRYARQVHHGVYIRMAVLDLLVNGTRERVS